jgi:hypothetical protein
MNRLLCLAALAAPAAAWSTLWIDRNATHRASPRWSARPAIRWAISPDLCDALRPRLWEYTDPGSGVGYDFSACERIHAAVRQAFSVWQANTGTVHFVEVSDRCAAEQLWRPIPEKECISSPWCKEQDTPCKARIKEGTVPDGAACTWEGPWSEEKGGPIDQTDLCSHATCFECERADIVVGGFAPHNRAQASP